MQWSTSAWLALLLELWASLYNEGRFDQVFLRQRNRKTPSHTHHLRNWTGWMWPQPSAASRSPWFGRKGHSEGKTSLWEAGWRESLVVFSPSFHFQATCFVLDSRLMFGHCVIGALKAFQIAKRTLCIIPVEFVNFICPKISFPKLAQIQARWQWEVFPRHCPVRYYD